MVSLDRSQNTIAQPLPGPLCFCTFYVDKHSRVSNSQGSNLCHSYVALGMLSKSLCGSVSLSIRESLSNFLTLHSCEAPRLLSVLYITKG